MPRNVIFSRAGSVERESQADYKVVGRSALELKDGSVFADPLFVDAARGDYRFREGSPALKLGIEPLDLDRARVPASGSSAR
ncbi:MAG: hypothetical protein IT158_27735, partial [Bryobacterales bacterium]|nr:hypothetical protein [Bryobacterales bacterium]